MKKILRVIFFIFIWINPFFAFAQVTDSLIVPVNISYACYTPLQWTSLDKFGLIVRGGTSSESGVHIHTCYEIIHYDTSLNEIFHKTFKLEYESYEQPIVWKDNSRLFLLFPFSRRPVSALIVYDFINKTGSQYLFKNSWEQPGEISGASAGKTVYLLYYENGKAFLDMFNLASSPILLHKEVPHQKEIQVANNPYSFYFPGAYFLSTNCNDSVFFITAPRLGTYDGAKLYGVNQTNFFINGINYDSEPTYFWSPFIFSWNNQLFSYSLVNSHIVTSHDTGTSIGIERAEIIKDHKINFSVLNYQQWDSLPEYGEWLKNNIWGMLSGDVFASLDLGQSFYLTGAEIGSARNSFKQTSDQGMAFIVCKNGMYLDNISVPSFNSANVSSNGFYRFITGHDAFGNLTGYCIGNRGIDIYRCNTEGKLLGSNHIVVGLNEWDCNLKPATYFAQGKPPEFWIPTLECGYFYRKNGIIFGTKSQGKGKVPLLCMYKFAL